MPTGGYPRQEIEDYYDHCWTPRFRDRHNPQSLAMHFGYYDETVQSSEDAKLRLNHYLLSLVRGAPGMRMLDAGCGFGGTAIYVARHLPGSTVVGVNLSTQQLELAARFVREAGVDGRVELMLGSYLETNLPDASFDAIYAIESFCHCGDRPSFAAEASRLLRPGGRMAVIDFHRTDAPLDTAETREAYEDVKRGFRLADYYEVPLRRIFEEAGFTECSLEDITPQATPGLVRSDTKARALLPELRVNGARPLFADHLKACQGLLSLTRCGRLIYAGFTARRG